MAKHSSQKHIYVYAHWKGIKEPSLMGILQVSETRGKEMFSFEYSKEWLKSGKAQFLDPDLQLYSGPQYLSDGKKSNFGIFLDSAPDRWGRMLMRRREALFARNENRKEKILSEADYLLGVFDGHRMGAIRFKTDEKQSFLNDNSEMASPPWTFLRDLEYASLQLEKDDIMNDDDYSKWLTMLMNPGSSLGGARPKASVIDPNGNLFIAKFPSRKDHIDMGAWEMVVHELAVKAEINIAEAKIEKFYSDKNTFLTKRFDRTQNGERVHFATAMSMLGYTDGSDFQDGVSYLQILEFLIQHGANTNEDLEELWRRIVFSICVTNTDDHLRNHGFLLTERGWVLSPAYDVNPERAGRGLKLNISENDNSLDLDLAREVAESFRLNPKKASQIIEQVKNSVTGWRKLANKLNIPKNEQEEMSIAFRTE